MRLIDADTIPYFPKRIVGEGTYNIVVQSYIEHMPTVEAIPIEWIKEWMNHPFLYQEIAEGTIEMMLEDWREESGRS